MRWENPEFLLLWWVLPLAAAVHYFVRRRHRRVARRFADHAMLDRLLPRPAAPRQWLKVALLLLGLACLTAAAARPRWGVYFEEVQSRGVDMFILLDVSRSMLAEDVAPNRLERAKSDIRDLIERMEGDRVGLIVFAGAAVNQVPLTTDHDFFLSTLADVDPDSAPRGGSLIGDAIRKALTALEPTVDRDRVLVIITDGEDHESFPEEAAAEAANRGIKIFTVGLGDTREGSRIPIRDENGNLTYLQHDGQELWSQMNEELLRKIAVDSGGAYIPARTQTYDLGQVYDNHLKSLARGEISNEKRKRFRDRFQWLLAAGAAVLLLETSIARYPRSHGSRQVGEGGIA